MHPRSTSEPTPQAPKPRYTPEFEELIRSRAYYLYEQRGRVDGHDLEDWLQAEAELTSKSETAAA
jgi:Protein of unknown function (DUF2934)